MFTRLLNFLVVFGQAKAAGQAGWILLYTGPPMTPVIGAQVAQLVEQWTENPRVGGSNPPLGTTFQAIVIRCGPKILRKL